MQTRQKTKALLDRRKFLRSLTRTGILSVLAGGSAYLLVRKGGGDADCDFDFVCRNCRKNSYCKLPEASVFRMNKK